MSTTLVPVFQGWIALDELIDKGFPRRLWYLKSGHTMVLINRRILPVFSSQKKARIFLHTTNDKLNQSLQADLIQEELEGVLSGDLKASRIVLNPDPNSLPPYEQPTIAV